MSKSERVLGSFLDVPDQSIAAVHSAPFIDSEAFLAVPGPSVGDEPLPSSESIAGSLALYVSNLRSTGTHFSLREDTETPLAHGSTFVDGFTDQMYGFEEAVKINPVLAAAVTKVGNSLVNGLQFDSNGETSPVANVIVWERKAGESVRSSPRSVLAVSRRLVDYFTSEHSALIDYEIAESDTLLTPFVESFLVGLPEGPLTQAHKCTIFAVALLLPTFVEVRQEVNKDQRVLGFFDKKLDQRAKMLEFERISVGKSSAASNN